MAGFDNTADTAIDGGVCEDRTTARDTACAAAARRPLRCGKSLTLLSRAIQARRIPQRDMRRAGGNSATCPRAPGTMAHRRRPTLRRLQAAYTAERERHSTSNDVPAA